MRWMFLICIWIGGCGLLGEKALPVCESGERLKLKLLESSPNLSCDSPTGSLAVEATTGIPPFRFALDDGDFQPSPNFQGVFGGDHLVRVHDARNCEGGLVVSIGTGGAVLTAKVNTTPDNQCFSDAGTITIAASGGLRPYAYQRDSAVAQTDSTLYGIKKGFHWVKVIDANGCTFQKVVEIEHGFTGISYARDVFPIITKYCAFTGCHNGDVGSNANFLVFNNVRTYGMLMVRYATAAHEVQVPDAEVAYIRCWVEDGRLNN